MSWEQRQEWFYVKSKQQRGLRPSTSLQSFWHSESLTGHLTGDTRVVWRDGEVDEAQGVATAAAVAGRRRQAGARGTPCKSSPSCRRWPPHKGILGWGEGGTCAEAAWMPPKHNPRPHASSRSQGRVNSQPREATEPNPQSVGDALPAPSPAVRGKSTEQQERLRPHSSKAGCHSVLLRASSSSVVSCRTTQSGAAPDCVPTHPRTLSLATISPPFCGAPTVKVGCRASSTYSCSACAMTTAMAYATKVSSGCQVRPAR